MREIKFRAWDTGKKEMVEPFSVVTLIYNFCDEFNYRIVSDSKLFSLKRSLGFVLMQFTGLKAKNGNEIYEGDILKWPSGSCAEVYYRLERMEFSLRNRLQTTIEGGVNISEVIGNIFDCGCGHQIDFSESTVSEVKQKSKRKRILDSSRSGVSRRISSQ